MFSLFVDVLLLIILFRNGNARGRCYCNYCASRHWIECGPQMVAEDEREGVEMGTSEWRRVRLHLRPWSGWAGEFAYLGARVSPFELSGGKTGHRRRLCRAADLRQCGNLFCAFLNSFSPQTTPPSRDGLSPARHSGQWLSISGHTLHSWSISSLAPSARSCQQGKWQHSSMLSLSTRLHANHLRAHPTMHHGQKWQKDKQTNVCLWVKLDSICRHMINTSKLSEQTSGQLVAKLRALPLR